MKKVLLLILALSMGGKYAIAQDAGENDLKNFRFGLKTTGMLTWFKPEDKKKYESGGVSARGSYGLITEFRLNKTASISTGFEVLYDAGKLNFLGSADPNYYYLSRDGEMMEFTDGANDSGATKYKLNSRTYRTTYLMIPLLLKLKTPEIGALTYFGIIGLNNSMRLKSRVDDDVNTGSATGANASQNDILNTSDINLFNFSLNVGLGAEWSIAGSTSLVFGLNFYNGFSNVVKPTSDYLFREVESTPPGNPTRESAKQNASVKAFALSVGVLF